MQEKPDYGEEIKAIIRSNASPKIMKAKLEDYHANDIAVILDELTAAQRIKVYRVLDDVMLSDILEYLDEDDASRFLGEMDPKRAAAVITEIEPDVAVAILRQIPRERRTLLIDLLDEESRNDVRLIASFDEEEIGSRMTTNYIAIRENLTIKEAMNELIRQAAENDNISTIFVVDETQEFYGAIDLKELIIARQGSNLEDLIVTSFPYVYGHEN
ncbi:MAG: magnesium transporter, partial [Firmicutes bacterium]|nr:magnesium transporter [Bacillota bacterium]